MKKQKESISLDLIGNLLKPLHFALAVILSSTIIFGCSSGDNEGNVADSQEASEETVAEEITDDGLGIGPVRSVEVGEEIDEELAATGKTIFEGKCAACHQLSDEKIVGPGLAGVTEKRKSEWIMNMVINPEEMTKKDPTAKKLLAEHMTQMTNQDVTEQDARAILEFLRKNDKEAS